MFEYDSDKSDANLDKHGIDFDTAQAVWDDSRKVMVAARSDTEPRFAVIGMIGNSYWTVFGTIRSENVRIISARRSRVSEVKVYEAQDD